MDQVELARGDLYWTAANWWRSLNVDSDFGRGVQNSHVIDAACEALAAGDETPAVMELAGTRADQVRFDLEPLVARAMDELHFEWPPPSDGRQPYRGYPAFGTGSRLRFEKTYYEGYPGPSSGPGSLEPLIDGDDSTMAVGGSGLSIARLVQFPWPLDAAVGSMTMPIEPEMFYWEPSVFVRITRDAGFVVWEWLDEDRIWWAHRFREEAYDAALTDARSALGVPCCRTPPPNQR